MADCKQIKNNGDQCKAQSLKDDDYCFWHSSKVRRERHEAVMTGGRASKKYQLDFEQWDYETTDSLVSLLELCINKTIRGEMPTKVSNSVAYLANVLLSTIKERDLEQRLEVIERVLQIKQEDQ